MQRTGEETGDQLLPAAIRPNRRGFMFCDMYVARVVVVGKRETGRKEKLAAGGRGFRFVSFPWPTLITPVGPC